MIEKTAVFVSRSVSLI